MSIRLTSSIAAALTAALVPTVAIAADSGHSAPEITRQQWPFSGVGGQFDKAQLQRGFQVYKEVCAQCHGMKRLYFRNLVQPGGPEFPEEAVKGLAAKWPNQIRELDDQGEGAVKTKDKDGKVSGFKYVTRPAKLSDPILGPYANDAAARANQNGALPPDLTLIAKARSVERNPNPLIHPFLMLGDMVNGYQEGGADYVHALLTGYTDAPADVTLNDGMYYNTYFPGHQLAMPPPLADGSVPYQDGTEPTLNNYSRDVTAFLSWAADPSHNQRKRIGWQVMLYLLVTTALLYLGKQRIWSKIEH